MDFSEVEHSVWCFKKALHIKLNEIGHHDTGL